MTIALFRLLHNRVAIVSDAFEGKSLVQRHRMVYTALDEELKAGLHALALKTKTPKEAPTPAT